MIEGGATLACPCCGSATFVPVDPGGGARQRFVSDCEVCCRPLDVFAEIDESGRTRVTARPEGGS